MKRLYLLSTDLDGEKVYKIGFTKNSVESRIKQLQTGNVSIIEIDFVYEADKYIVSIETRLHKQFDSKRINGEWFDLNSDEVNSIPELCNKYYNMFVSLENNSYLNGLKSKPFK